MSKVIDIKATTGKKGTTEFKEITGTCVQYDSLAEAAAELTEAVAIKKLNAQLETDARNALRAGATIDPQKKMVKDALNTLLTQIMAIPDPEKRAAMLEKFNAAVMKVASQG